MKVLQVGKYYPPYMGGIETHLEALSRSLRNAVEVEVLVSNSANVHSEEKCDGIPVTRAATPYTVASAPLSPGLISRIRKSKADLVHVHLPNPGAVLAYLMSGRRGPMVATYHSDTFRQVVLGALFEPILHLFLRRAGAIFATSPNYQATSPVLQRHLERCHVVPYGIDTAHFSAADPKAVAGIQARYGNRVIIGVGRLVYYKGFEFLIQAMREIQGVLLLVGDGPLRGALEQRARDCGVAEKVVFLGGLQNNEVIPYYHAAQVFALPSVARSEAFGIVQIEAMSAGLPVVNTSLDSGVPFVSLHEQTGLTVPPRDPGALSAAINRLLDNPGLRNRLGAEGRVRASQFFSVPRMQAETLGIYQQVLTEAGSSQIRG